VLCKAECAPCASSTMRTAPWRWQMSARAAAAQGKSVDAHKLHDVLIIMSHALKIALSSLLSACSYDSAPMGPHFVALSRWFTTAFTEAHLEHPIRSHSRSATRSAQLWPAARAPAPPSVQRPRRWGAVHARCPTERPSRAARTAACSLHKGSRPSHLSSIMGTYTRQQCLSSAYADNTYASRDSSSSFAYVRPTSLPAI